MRAPNAVLIMVVSASLLLSGCATVAVTSAVVGTAATVTKVAVKGTVGAGKLAYRGTKAAVKGTGKLLSSSRDADVEEYRRETVN